MAIYHPQLQSISRAAGRSAVGAAAYRAGECLRDERIGVLHNHSGRRDARVAREYQVALQAAGVDARIDHRSYQARDIDREPQPHIPYAAVLAERRSLRGQMARRLRERYWGGADYSAGESLEQVRRQARDTWLRLRREALQPSESAHTAQRDRTDGDLVL